MLSTTKLKNNKRISRPGSNECRRDGAGRGGGHGSREPTPTACGVLSGLTVLSACCLPEEQGASLPLSFSLQSTVKANPVTRAVIDRCRQTDCYFQKQGSSEWSISLEEEAQVSWEAKAATARAPNRLAAKSNSQPADWSHPYTSFPSLRVLHPSPSPAASIWPSLLVPRQGAGHSLTPSEVGGETGGEETLWSCAPALCVWRLPVYVLTS